MKFHEISTVEVSVTDFRVAILELRGTVALKYRVWGLFFPKTGSFLPERISGRIYAYLSVSVSICQVFAFLSTFFKYASDTHEQCATLKTASSLRNMVECI